MHLLKQVAKSDSRVKVLSNVKNSGAAVSRNNSIKHAQGDFLAFLDSDDVWLTDKLEKQLKFMTEGINLSFTGYELIDERSDRLNKTVDSTQSGSFTYHDMLKKKATMGCSTVMVRCSQFDDMFMPLLRTGQDYALWLKLLKTGEHAYVMNEVLTQYRILSNSISRNKFKKAKRQWQIYREVECLGFISSSINFFFYAWRAIFRKP